MLAVDHRGKGHMSGLLVFAVVLGDYGVLLARHVGSFSIGVSAIRCPVGEADHVSNV